MLDELRTANARFVQELLIEVDPSTRQTTLGEIAREREQAAAAIDRDPTVHDVDLQRCVDERRGDRRISRLLERHLGDRGLAGLDRELARSFVSNPNSGELVKGHAIVLAELGLCPYRGRIPRDPELLRAPWSRELRGRHVICRLGFLGALWQVWGTDTVTLYRASAADAPLSPPRAGSLVSATFSAAVAQAHYEGGPSTVAAAMWRQRVPVGRVFMSFLETAAMNEQFLEAEAVLIGDPGNGAF